MDFLQLQKDMISALKSGDKSTRESIAMLVSAIKKAAIDGGTRNNISSDLVDSVILKEMKSAQEQIDTCPASRQDLLEKYKANLEVIKKYAPVQMDAESIKKLLTEKYADIIAGKNKGQIMKAVMTELKGKADGKLISQIVAEFCK